MITDDISAWQKYPHHRLWFNKLWLSEQLGYCCGPGGITVPKENFYCVRPIYNLRGMGAGAKIIKLSPDDITAVEPGYFWCEVFEGDQYTIDLQWKQNQWHQLSCYQGVNTRDKLYKFDRWIKTSKMFDIPNILNQLKDCEYINIEIIDNKIIEVHLRISPDPNFNELIPVWENDNIIKPHGYKWIESLDNANGHIEQKRLGFFVK